MLKIILAKTGRTITIMLIGIVICISIGHLHPVPEALQFIDYLICNINDCEGLFINDSPSRSAAEYRHLLVDLTQHETGTIHFAYYDLSFSQAGVSVLETAESKLFQVSSTTGPQGCKL